MIQYDMYIYDIGLCNKFVARLVLAGNVKKTSGSFLHRKRPTNTLFQLDAMIIPNEIHVIVRSGKLYPLSESHPKKTLV